MLKKILIASLFIVAITLGVYYFENKQVVDERSQNEVAGSVDTTDWKTHKYFGFEFKYPKTWYLFESSERNDYIAFRNSTDISCEFSSHPNFDDSVEGKDYILESKEHVLIDGDQYVKTKRRYFEDQDLQISIEDFPISGRRFSLLSIQNGLPFSENCLNDFNKIVTTIKFTDKLINTETLNWKTYKNEKYGFEFKYPSSLELNVGGNYIQLFGKESETGLRQKIEIWFDLSDIDKDTGNIWFKKIKSSNLEWNLGKHVAGPESEFGGSEYVIVEPVSTKNTKISAAGFTFTGGMHGSKYSEELANLMDLIFSTIKFTK